MGSGGVHLVWGRVDSYFTPSKPTLKSARGSTDEQVDRVTFSTSQQPRVRPEILAPTSTAETSTSERRELDQTDVFDNND